MWASSTSIVTIRRPTPGSTSDVTGETHRSAPAERCKEKEGLRPFFFFGAQIDGQPAFWNERYRTLPWIGSGPGSRGISQQYKASLLRKALLKNDITSVVDVGCGDLCWLRTDRLSVHDLQGIRYVGLDISEAAVDANRRTFPELEFELYDLGRDPLPMHADLVLCFDVLIHQTSREQFDTCLTHLLDGIPRYALVSYMNPVRPRKAIMPHLEALDSAVEAESEFRQSLAELKARGAVPQGDDGELRGASATGLGSVGPSHRSPCRELRLSVDLRGGLRGTARALTPWDARSDVALVSRHAGHRRGYGIEREGRRVDDALPETRGFRTHFFIRADRDRAADGSRRGR